MQESDLAEHIGNGLWAEQDLVTGLLEEVLADLPQGLLQFVRSEVAKEQILAGIVLASAAPVHDSAEAVSRRAALAAALELLQVGLRIHRLLLNPAQPDTIDSFLLGGTILAGDFFFSRAAVLAARTHHPQVVKVFAELLKEVSQANLRRVIDGGSASAEVIAADEREALFHSSALAGVVLAGLAVEEGALVTRFASRLSRDEWADGAAFPDSECGGVLDNGLPRHQLDRWRAVVSAIRS
jgi:hypothetical protein